MAVVAVPIFHSGLIICQTHQDNFCAKETSSRDSASIQQTQAILLETGTIFYPPIPLQGHFSKHAPVR